MRYGRWQDAMVVQTRLAEWSLSSEGLRYLQYFFEDMNRKHTIVAQRDVPYLGAIQVRSLQEAEPCYMSHEACEIVDHARHSFEPEPTLLTDPWTPFGFVLLAKPIDMYDAPPTKDAPLRSPTGRIPIRAVAWMPIISEDDPNVGTWWISHYVDYRDEVEAAKEYGVEDNRWGEFVDDPRMRRMPISLVHQYQWTFGAKPWEGELDVLPEEDPDETNRRALAQTKFVQTLWRIGSQVVPVKERAPRGIWRDAQRRGMKHKDVTVITLRRGREGEEHEPTGRTVSVSFLVRGYWARRHTREGVRQVWVRPHLKGQGPFRETTRAWEFKR